MTKIVCISDTHVMPGLPSITNKKCDILIHAGDATMNGSEEEIAEFAQWFGDKHVLATHRIFVPGNHDFLFEDDEALARRIMQKNADVPITILNQETVTACGLNIYGEPRQPYFRGGAYGVAAELMAKEVWGIVPEDTHILVTHGPPRGHGDLTRHGDHVGCPDQTKFILGGDNAKNLKLVVCGHIHPSYGFYLMGGGGSNNNNNVVLLINAAVCNDRYQPDKRALVINI